MWKFDLNTLKWIEIEFSGNYPPSMYGFGYQTLLEDDNLKFYVYGGKSISFVLDQTWV